MGVNPQYSVSVDGNNLTEFVRERLIYLRILDESSGKNSRVEIQLDNRPPYIDPPTEGATISVALGYDGALRDMGTYEFDECVIFGAPHTITIIGSGKSTGSDIKGVQNRSWHNQTVGQILQSLASTNGLVANIDPSLSGVQVDHIDQTNQSDMAFMNDLIRKNNGAMKIMNGTLYAAPQDGSASTATGVTVDMTEDTRYEYQYQARGNYGGARARYTDKASGEEKMASAGDPTTNAIGLADMHPDATTAQNAAQSALDAAQRTEQTFNVTVPGDPLIMSATPLTATSFPPQIPPSWNIDKAEHLFMGKAAYTTMAACTIPGASAAGGDAGGGAGGSGGNSDGTEPSDNKEGGNDGHTITEQVDGNGTIST